MLIRGNLIKYIFAKSTGKRTWFWKKPLAPEGDIYRFNAKTQFPEQLHPMISDLLARSQGKQLKHPEAAKQHIDERLGQGARKVHFDDIPGLNGRFPSAEQGFAPVEVEYHPGKKQITKMIMRGPYGDQGDMVHFPVKGFDENDPNSYFVPTVWLNNRSDEQAINSGGLDLRRVHLPREFHPEQPPKRALYTKEEADANPAGRIPHTSKAISDYISKDFSHGF